MLQISIILATVGVIAWSLRRRSVGLLLAWMIALAAIGAWDLRWRIADRPSVAVIVDVSPSMRGADAWEAFPAMVARLARHARVRPFELSNGLIAIESERLSAVGERSAAQTTIDQWPDADAIVLISDGHFDAPTPKAPILVLIDPAIDAVRDDRVMSMQTTRVGTIVATQINGQRQLQWTADERVDLGADDRWPENDAMTAPLATGAPLERFWIGLDRVEGFEPLVDASQLLRASVLVINDASLGQIGPFAPAIEAYARSMGGAVVLAGVGNSFGAGQWTGSPIDAISPLASRPPDMPMSVAMVFDVSGSMAGVVGNRTKLDHAADASMQLMRALDASTRFDIGTFAREFEWVARSANASIQIEQMLPQIARGPTNLNLAIDAIIDAGLNVAPGVGQGLDHAIIFTDSAGQIEDVDSKIGRLVAGSMRLHIVTTPGGSDNAALARLVESTNGSMLQVADVSQWAARMTELGGLMQVVEPIEQNIALGWIDDSQTTAARFVPTWVRPGADPLARDQADRIHAARWQVGLGNVIAVSAEVSASKLASLAQSIERTPIDSAIRVEVSQSAVPRVRVWMEEHEPELFIDGERRAMSKIAPGVFELIVPTSESSRTGAVIAEGRSPIPITLPGTYDREFAEIGIDRKSLDALAQQSGGAVVESIDELIEALPESITQYRPAVLCVPLAMLCGLGVIFNVRR